MRLFLFKHPIISLLMVGMVCVTVVETTDIIVNKSKSNFHIKKEKKDELEG